MEEHESGAHGRVVLSLRERCGGLVTAAWGQPFLLPPSPPACAHCYWEFLLVMKRFCLWGRSKIKQC